MLLGPCVGSAQLATRRRLQSHRHQLLLAPSSVATREHHTRLGLEAHRRRIALSGFHVGLDPADAPSTQQAPGM